MTNPNQEPTYLQKPLTPEVPVEASLIDVAGNVLTALGEEYGVENTGESLRIDPVKIGREVLRIVNNPVHAGIDALLIGAEAAKIPSIELPIAA